MPLLSIRRTLARGLLVAAVWAGIAEPPRFAAAGAEPALAREPTWSIPTATAVRTKVEQWPAGSASPAVDPTRTAALQAAWDDVAAGRRDLLDTVVEAIGDREPRAATLVVTAARGQDPAVAWL
jgi:hypothetical protein